VVFALASRHSLGGHNRPRRIDASSGAIPDKPLLRPNGMDSTLYLHGIIVCHARRGCL
jgi:hypothetical protein